MMRSVVDQFNEYAKLNKKLSQDAGEQLGDIEDPSRLADAIAAQILSGAQPGNAERSEHGGKTRS